jgi:hypothetical protein
MSFFGEIHFQPYFFLRMRPGTGAKRRRGPSPVSTGGSSSSSSTDSSDSSATSFTSADLDELQLSTTGRYLISESRKRIAELMGQLEELSAELRPVRASIAVPGAPSPAAPAQPP